jgi:PAS domain S-box-containing protein
LPVVLADSRAGTFLSDGSPMSWIDIAWPMIGATSLTLGLIYLLVWIRQPDRYGYLLFFMTAISVAVFSIFELRMMRAETAQAFAATLRWAHVPMFVLVVSIVGFVRFYLRSGRAWLGYTLCGVRALGLVLDFTTGVNVNFSQVTEMVALPVWGGESIYVPVGVANPYAAVPQLSNVLLLAFLADASVGLWRRGDAQARRRAIVVGGSMFLCVLAGSFLAVLLNHGVLRIPTMISVAFLGVVIAMAYELGWDLIAAGRLNAELRVSQAKLRESEQRLELAAGAAELGLWEWNIAADDVWMTRESRVLFGYRDDEAVGLKRFLASVHPEDRAAVERGVTTAMTKGGKEFGQDFRIVAAGADTRWVHSRGRIERDGSGAAVSMRGVTLDITGRKQAEERFRALVEAAPSAMLQIDAAGTIVLVNAVAETTFGYPRQELVGRPVETLIPERLREAHFAHRAAYVLDARARAMGAGRELFARRKDGTEVPVEVGLNPMQTLEGRFVLASVVDVSQRKQGELEAARQRDEMAHLARVAMLGELSGSLAHELNQPLAAILSNAQAAQRFLNREAPPLDRVREILADIVKSDRRAGAVITRLRSLLRKEYAQHLPVNMNEVVEEVLQLMRSDFLSRQVSVRAELASNLPPVSGDRVQLQQVLLNLLINGSDAMAGVERQRELVVFSEWTAQEHVRVSVADRGVGIGPEDIERIFEPFVTTKPTGMGMGLAVCRTIVKAHSGWLWAVNNADGGATLHVELPAIPLPGRERAGLAPGTAAGHSSTGPRSS